METKNCGFIFMISAQGQKKLKYKINHQRERLNLNVNEMRIGHFAFKTNRFVFIHCCKYNIAINGYCWKLEQIFQQEKHFSNKIVNRMKQQPSHVRDRIKSTVFRSQCFEYFYFCFLISNRRRHMRKIPFRLKSTTRSWSFRAYLIMLRLFFRAFHTKRVPNE